LAEQARRSKVGAESCCYYPEKRSSLTLTERMTWIDADFSQSRGTPAKEHDPHCHIRFCRRQSLLPNVIRVQHCFSRISGSPAGHFPQVIATRTIQGSQLMAMSTPICDFGWPAPDFSLPGTDGRTYTRADVTGPNGLLVMFICNHCPYVKAILDRLINDCRLLTEAGIGCVAIMSNDPALYSEDSFENMATLAATKHFPFPYLYDETQAVARAYDAVCTPDFFGFNANLQLQYRGRLDASGKAPAAPDARRDLLEAMREIGRSGRGPAEQIPSMGCSIKWRD
jgi:peroxiredoxin